MKAEVAIEGSDGGTVAAHRRDAGDVLLAIRHGVARTTEMGVSRGVAAAIVKALGRVLGLRVEQQFRRRLPPRHESRNLKFRPRILGGKPALHLMLGFYLSAEEAVKRRGLQADGPLELGEVFIAGPLSGSVADAQRKEFATLLSLALQWGMPLSEIAENMQRDQQGQPLTVFGEVVDEVVDELVKETNSGGP